MSFRSLSMALWVSFACVGCSPELPEVTLEDEDDVASTVTPDASTTLDVGNFNIEWFGDPSRGPTDDALQLARAGEVLRRSEVDLWVLSEIVDEAQFERLLHELPGFTGFLSNDPIVGRGAEFYSTSEQKLAIVYRTEEVTVTEPRLILTEQAFDFGSRPPLAVDVAVAGGEPFTLIGLHMKAMSDAASYARRARAAQGLEALLEGALGGESVLVIGDWNDDIDRSISGRATPFASLSTMPGYRFLTETLSLANLGSRTTGTSFIDHQFVGGPLAQSYLEGSTRLFDVEAFVEDYGDTTSDHYPVISRFSFDAKPFINELLVNEPGSDTAREFVEIVAGCGSVDLSGYALSSDGVEVFEFPEGTRLESGESWVVFGRAKGIEPGVEHALASQGLRLRNGGGTLTLADAAGREVSVVSWTSSSPDGTSLTREIDGDRAAGFVAHSSLSTRRSSPGRTVSGHDFATCD